MLREFWAREKLRKEEKKFKKQMRKLGLKVSGLDDVSIPSEKVRSIAELPQIQYTQNTDLFGEMVFLVWQVTDDMKYIVFKPRPDYTVEILTANNQCQVKWSTVVEVSVHAGLEGYQIIPKQEYLQNFKIKSFSLKVSNDHSLFVYDKQKERFIKATPKRVSRQPDRYCFVGYPTKLFCGYESVESYPDLAFIPCNWFEFKPEKDLILYDITTDDPEYCYFHVSPGIFVVDTVIVYALHTEEAKREAIEKMALSKNLISSEKISDMTYGIDKNSLFGLIVGSKTAKENQYEYKPKKFNYTVSSLKELRQLLMTDLAGKYTVFDFVTVDKQEMTIGQAMIYLTIKETLPETNKK